MSWQRVRAPLSNGKPTLPKVHAQKVDSAGFVTNFRTVCGQWVWTSWSVRPNDEDVTCTNCRRKQSTLNTKKAP